MDGTTIAVFAGVIIAGNGLLVFFTRVIGSRNGNGREYSKLCAQLKLLDQSLSHHDEHAQETKRLVIELVRSHQAMTQEMRNNSRAWRDVASSIARFQCPASAKSGIDLEGGPR